MQQELFRSKIVERLATIETSHIQLLKSVDLILTNHLPHIQTEIEEIKIKINSNPTWLVTSIITILSATVTGLIVKVLCQ